MKRVRFSSVQVRQYAVCEGDHPHCHLPMSLDWQHTETELRHIETYEGMKSLHKNSKKHSFRRLSIYEREQRIRNVGSNFNGDQRSGTT